MPLHQFVQRHVALVGVVAAIIMSLAVVVSPAAAALDDPGPWSFTLAGTGFSDNDFDNTTLGFDLGLGRYFGPVELGVRQTVNYTSTDSDAVDDIWSGSTRVFADLEFKFGAIAPFIGANIGYTYGDLVDDQFIAGPEAGLKIYVGDDHDTFIFGRVEYQFFFEDSDEAEDAFDDGQFVYTIGVGFRF